MTQNSTRPSTPEQATRPSVTATPPQENPPQEPVQPRYLHDGPLRGGVLAQRRIPKNPKHIFLLSVGAVLFFAVAALLVWGFVAPVVEPDVPPAAADGEIPVPD